MTTEEAIVEEVQPDPIAEKFTKQENQFTEVEKNLAALRRFMVVHHDALALLDWRCYGYDNSIVLNTYNQKPKDVALAFGKDGWKREHNSYSCGSIDWHKTIDGVLLKIENAENIKPTLREEVKFPGE